jgi:Protein of unknown function DUF89.
MRRAKEEHITRVADIRHGTSSKFEAWLYHFLIENNIEFLLSPSIVASPEQLRFMVALEDDQVYLPCDDELFVNIYEKNNARVKQEYVAAWRFVVRLIISYKLEKKDAQRLLAFCRHRYRLYYSSGTLLPSRMIKRLVGIVLTQCGSGDPFADRKREANATAAAYFDDQNFVSQLYSPPSASQTLTDINDMRHLLDLLEMKRLMRLGALVDLHHASAIASEDLCAHLREMDEDVSELLSIFPSGRGNSKKILFMPDRAGGLVFDIELVKTLLRSGHRVILSLKDAFYFSSPTFWDVESDPVLRTLLENACQVENSAISKNELLRLLREHRFLIISDGTSEQLNLYRTSATFARAWKECDLVIAKGRRMASILIGTSHEFTRDIMCYYGDEDDSFHLHFKPRAPWSTKFAESDLVGMANEIIEDMQQAKDRGQTVMFYSAVIGSIPGQTKTAIQVVTAFVKHLRRKMENTFIINPAEHFVDGMDGDDLMYMWERVQRSGLLDVWRFQTADDIEQSFALMKQKLPAMWLGKDATFSTGCTKEMRIALDVQHQYPELQIIGPQPERFFRRRDYGIGKYYDATLKG